jgi:uncharacterized protein YcaQ
MTDTTNLTLQAARNLALAAQGLLPPPTHQAEKSDLLKAIRRIHALQIDTINIVERAPYHTLWTRVGDYPKAWLDELLAEKHLFEYWAHAACFLPIEDYPLYRRLMLDDRVGWDNIKQWGGDNQPVLDAVMTHIQQNGAVRSADFERPKNGGGWWNWKLEKVALEYLFTRGDLMISRREKFQRVYDLRERVIPEWDDNRTLSSEEALRQQVLNAIKALGVAREDWVALYFYLPKLKVVKLIQQFADEGRVLRIDVEGLNSKPFYLHKDNLDLFSQAQAGTLEPALTTILSPFDNLVNDRARTRTLFNFDYTIECYTPAAKRVYGYFCLPILHRGKLIGRLDAKAWRKEKYLEAITLHLEPGTVIDDRLIADLKHVLTDYASWQGLPVVRITRTVPEDLKALL